MKQILLLLLCFTTSILLSQDITYSPATVELALFTSDIDKKVDIDISNAGNVSDFWWTIDRGTTPDEWSIYLCDFNLCYTPTVTTCPCGKPNDFSSTSGGVLMLHVSPNDTPGSGVITINLFGYTDESNCDGVESIVSIPVTTNVERPSSTFDKLNEDINIYPNPVNTAFKVSEDEAVDQIVFFNIIGKKIKSINHQKGMSHDISELGKGIYLVRLMDKNQDILKVLRLTKE